VDRGRDRQSAPQGPLRKVAKVTTDRTTEMHPQLVGVVVPRSVERPHFPPPHTELSALILPQLARLNLDYAY
jgi:hypothetical protein